jgi:hypothetical protein
MATLSGAENPASSLLVLKRVSSFLPHVSERLATLISFSEYRSFASEHYDGRDRTDLSFVCPKPSEAFLERWNELTCLLMDVVVRWSHEDAPDFVGGQGQGYPKMLALCEALLNSELLRWCDAEQRSISFSSLAVFAGAPFQWDLRDTGLGSIGFRLERQGWMFSWWPKDCAIAPLVQPPRTSGRPRLFPSLESGPEPELEAMFPLRLSSKHELGLVCLSNYCGRQSVWDRWFPQSLLALEDKQPRKRSPEPGFCDRNIAALRFAAREVCRIIEEWEFTNAVLAVRYVRTRQDPHLEGLLAAVLHERDHFALWVLSSLYDIGELYNSALDEPSTDVFQESLALKAVVLASLLKVCLPASVSRHQYHPYVMQQMLGLFDQLRCQQESSPRRDLALELARLACRAEWDLSQDVAGSLVESCESLCDWVCEGPSHRWSFSFDPSVVIKSFAWAHRPDAYLASVLTLLCVLRRRQNAGATGQSEQRLDAEHSMLLLSLLQMPVSFGQGRFPDLDRRSELPSQCSEVQLFGTQSCLMGSLRSSAAWLCDDPGHEVAPGLTLQQAWMVVIKQDYTWAFELAWPANSGDFG